MEGATYGYLTCANGHRNGQEIVRRTWSSGRGINSTTSTGIS